MSLLQLLKEHFVPPEAILVWPPLLKRNADNNHSHDFDNFCILEQGQETKARACLLPPFVNNFIISFIKQTIFIIYMLTVAAFTRQQQN